jgi:serine protease Do
VQLQNIDDDLAESLGLESKLGSLVSDVVPGSPAERAGVEVGDVILGYDGDEVADARALSRMVGSSDSGDKVVLSVLRGDDEIKLKVVLGDAETQIAANGKEQDMNDLGLTLAPLTDDLRERLGVDEKLTGAVVLKVEPNGIAAEQGIRRGDILMRADRQIIHSPADFLQAFADAKKRGRSSVPVLVKRGDIQQFASLPVA